jgi:hypothetical protein
MINMELRKTSVVPSIPVAFGEKVRNLKFTFWGGKRYEDSTGKKLLVGIQNVSPETTTMDELVTMLWASAVWEDDTVSIKDIAIHMDDYYQFYVIITDLIGNFLGRNQPTSETLPNALIPSPNGLTSGA